jgi:ribonuclease III
MLDSNSFNNPKILEEALTHRSYLNETSSVNTHNERLEFLGDAVLELAVSQYLFERFPDSPEGELTAYRSSLVKTDTLAAVSKSLGFGDLLRMSKGESLSGGRTNASLLANTFEAVIGALYLDQGFSQVVSFLEEHLFHQIDPIIKTGSYKDKKSHLQEVVQARGYESPVYRVIDEAGPDHNKIFTVACFINNTKIATGTGKSKQTAQQHAAAAALENWSAS